MEQWASWVTYKTVQACSMGQWVSWVTYKTVQACPTEDIPTTQTLNIPIGNKESPAENKFALKIFKSQGVTYYPKENQQLQPTVELTFQELEIPTYLNTKISYSFLKNIKGNQKKDRNTNGKIGYQDFKK